MRVGIVTFKSHAVSIYAIQLANGMSDVASVHLFMGDDAAARYGAFVNPDVTVHPFRIYRYRDPRSLLMSWKLVRDIKESHCDVIHFSYPEPWFNLFMPFLKSFPLVTTIHDVDPHVGDDRSHALLRVFGDLALRYSDAFIVYGESLKEKLRGRLPGGKAIHVIPHMNYSFYRHWERGDVAEERNNILFFGSIWEYKGLKYLMMAEPYLAARLKNFRITIAGRGESFENYRSYMRNSDRYEIINEHIPDAQVAGLFARASVVVLPYIEASQSGVAPLAFAFGKPVVCTDVGSIPEMVNDGVNGFIVKPGDPEALADAICRILEDSGLKRRMSENARNKAYGELSWTRVGRLHLEAYEETLLRKSK